MLCTSALSAGSPVSPLVLLRSVHDQSVAFDARKFVTALRAFGHEKRFFLDAIDTLTLYVFTPSATASQQQYILYELLAAGWVEAFASAAARHVSRFRVAMRVCLLVARLFSLPCASTLLHGLVPLITSLPVYQDESLRACYPMPQLREYCSSFVSQ